VAIDAVTEAAASEKKRCAMPLKTTSSLIVLWLAMIGVFMAVLRVNAVASRLRQTDFATAQELVGSQVQSVIPSGALSNTFQATGFIVNCPVVSLDVNRNR
jgi:hypothetical protein